MSQCRAFNSAVNSREHAQPCTYPDASVIAACIHRQQCRQSSQRCANQVEQNRTPTPAPARACGCFYKAATSAVKTATCAAASHRTEQNPNPGPCTAPQALFLQGRSSSPVQHLLFTGTAIALRTAARTVRHVHVRIPPHGHRNCASTVLATAVTGLHTG